MGLHQFGSGEVVIDSLHHGVPDKVRFDLIMTRRGPRNDITDVAGIAVGHFHRIEDGWLTGTTVVLPPKGTVAGVDVRGGGPGTRETDCLEPTTMVSTIDAICLSGGSAYGLDAASGVVSWLAEHQRGFQVGPEPHHIVPIVPAAVLFDLGAGGNFMNHPDGSFGYEAARRATMSELAQGTVGAGAGARAGGLKGGIGSASTILPNGITIGVLIAVNSSGSPVSPATGELWGAGYGIADEFAHLCQPNATELKTWLDMPRVPRPLNTTLAIIATDAKMAKHECTRLASVGHDGMARAINPIHQYTDGDLVFALATGEKDFPEDDLEQPKGALQSVNSRVLKLNEIFNAAADCVARAIVHAMLNATSVGTTQSYRDRFPSAFVFPK